MASRAPGKTDLVFQLKVTLLKLEPPVWRRLLVPSNIALGRMHRVVNEVMGWTNSHLHSFAVGARTFGDPSLDPDGELEYEDERRVALDAILSENQSLIYTYDFGDGWDHELRIEKLLRHDPRLTYPLCIDGARACPPEDCGGVPGYLQLLASLRVEDVDSLTWVGGHFDPEGFDANRTNQALRALRR